MQIQAPKGTNDILPEEIDKWKFIEDVTARLCRSFGYKEIRTPVFEHTELFQRGVGETVTQAPDDGVARVDGQVVLRGDVHRIDHGI